MKLIIDIPDYDYEYICNNCIVPIKYDNHIYKAIVQGEPYEERPKGEWIIDKIGLIHTFECNICRVCVGTTNTNFCPNCGAQMKEGEEE